ncbi:hypothetical protein Tco_1215948 [Tanacetum coccineum]
MAKGLTEKTQGRRWYRECVLKCRELKGRSQCKKQTIVATSSTEAEYVAAANCCGQCYSWCCMSFYWWLYWFLLTEQFLLVVLLVSAGRVVPAGMHCVLTSIHDSSKKIWSTAHYLSSESGPPAIVATIDDTPYTITESLVRSNLLLDDAGGIVDMTIAEIYTGMHNLGYPTEGKLTITMNKFSPSGGDSSGEAEPSVPPNVPEIVTETVPSHEQVSTHLTAPTNSDVNVNEQVTCWGLLYEQGKKIENLESELQAHKLLFKEVMGTLAEEHDVDPLIKLAKAAASAADTSPIPSNDIQTADIPPGASTHTTAFGSDADVPTGPSFGFSADPFNKGKSPMVEEDPPIKQREQVERLGRTRGKTDEVGKRMFFNSAKSSRDDDWIRIWDKISGSSTPLLFLLESNPSTAGVPSNPSPFVDTSPHSHEFTPVSPSKPSDAAPTVAASDTEVPPAVPRTTGPRTRSKSIDADIKTYTTRAEIEVSRPGDASSEVDLMS